MPASLSVNLNAVAMLRNRRDLPWPSVTAIGALALEAGAHGLTVHPRPDERHIRRRDVDELKHMLKTDYKDHEFNIEGYPDTRFMKIIEDIRPDQVTLVPDDPAQATSDHGWDIKGNRSLLQEIIKQAQDWGCRVSLFVDPDPKAVEQAASVTTDRVELYTGPYGACLDTKERAVHLADLKQCVKAARKLKLGLNAGHDLTLGNLADLVSVAPHLDEVSIGHAITADSLIYGMKGAVERYIALLNGGKV